jgi:hypothetical protein
MLCPDVASTGMEKVAVAATSGPGQMNRAGTVR